MYPWWNIDLGVAEIQSLVGEVIQNRRFSLGSYTEDFEHELSKLTGFRHIICTTSGSTALLMASIAAGVSERTTAVVPNRTWIATAHAPHLLGAKISLCDTEHERPIICADRQGKSADNLVVYPVSLNGASVDYAKLKAEFPDAVIIEDCAQSLLSKPGGKQCGLDADMACFSLGMAKFLPVGQGGFVGTNNQVLAEKLRMIRTHGVMSVDDRTPYSTLGFNFRPSDITMSIGLAQISKLSERAKNLVHLWHKYEKAFLDLEIVEMVPSQTVNGELPLYAEILAKDPSAISKQLKKHGIETRIVYPDLDTAKYLRFSDCSDRVLMSSRKFGRHGLVLPCGPDQKEEVIDMTIDIIRKMQTAP